jgi:single-strand DNA-binding protein
MATRSWNRVELIGNVTRDPEMRYTPQGTAVCTFSIATNRTFVSDGEKREEADFHRIVAWSKLAELCSQLIKKGNRVFVSGRLQNRSWEGQDGQNRQTTEIVIEDMILLTSKFGAEGSYSGGEELPAELAHDVPSRSVDEMPKASKAEKAEKPEKAAKEETATEDVGDLDDLPF